MGIRIITEWAGDGVTPERWIDYPDRESGEVTGTLALRFDSELMALKQAGLSLGVRRWTEARWRIQRFAGEVRERIQALAADDSPVPEGARGDDLDSFIASHPDFFLSQQVAIWAAVNLGGGRMTLAEVLELADRDVINLAEVPDFIPDEESEELEDEGKA